MTAWKEEVRRRLEAQAGIIEDLLKNDYRVPVVVTGGVVYPRVFEFHIQGPTRRVSNRLAAVQNQLAAVLAVPEVVITCDEKQMTIRVRQWNSSPIMLLELMHAVGEVRPLTTILGALEGGRPLLLHLPSSGVSNILVVGSGGAGKTSLLRAFLLSLAARNRQHQLQAVLIDFDPAVRSGEPYTGPLAAFSHLPHLMEPVAATLPRALQVLDFLVEELGYRQEKDVAYPKILLVVDNLDSLLAAGQETLLHRLLHLLQYGAQAGIHLLLALEKPAGPFTNLLLKSDFSMRFVGRLRNEKMARAAAGIPDTRAERLSGQGDFIAVTAGQTYRFQTAFISDYDLYLGVESLNKQKQKKMLARAVEIRPGLLPSLSSN